MGPVRLEPVDSYFASTRSTTFLSMSTPNVREMIRAIRGHPNRGLRDLSSTMARMRASLGPFGPGFFGVPAEEKRRAVLAAHRRVMESQQRGRAHADGNLPNPSRTQKQ